MNSKTAAILAAITTASVGTVAALDANRPALNLRVAIDAGACVIPDCRTLLGRGAWDPQHAPVDCLAVGPFMVADAGVWRGCSVLPAEYAAGSACLPARCAVVSGEDPLEVMP